MLDNIIVFVLASLVGREVISKVPQTLHTPLMSGSNAISGITIVGALVVAGMVEGDQLSVAVNGKQYAQSEVQRSFDADGQSKEEGREIAPFYLYHVSLTAPPAVVGDNELQLQLTNSAGTENLVAQEFEVRVTRIGTGRN